MHLRPVLHVLSLGVCGATRLVHETEPGPDLLMNLFVVFVDDVVVELGILLVSLDPCLLHSQKLPSLVFSALDAEGLRAEVEQELLI